MDRKIGLITRNGTEYKRVEMRVVNIFKVARLKMGLGLIGNIPVLGRKDHLINKDERRVDYKISPGLYYSFRILVLQSII